MALDGHGTGVGGVRVLMVSRLWPPSAVGGAERYAADLAAHLQEDGHQVGVVTYGVEGDRVVATVPTHGVDPERWWASSTTARRRSHLLDLWNPETSRALRRATAAFAPDVVHSHAVAAMSVAALLAPAPRVHTVHDHWLRCWRGSPIRDDEPCRSTCLSCVPYATTRRAILRGRAPLFVAPADEVRRAHVDAGWDPRRWRVVRHPVAAVPAPRRARPLGRGAGLRLGFIGQLSRAKGVDLLLDALADLTTATLVVAGEGPLAPAVRAHERVELRGVVAGEDKERFFSDVDLLVVPSRVPEVAPLVLDEASARGLPVVASDRGGIPEYVPDGCRPLLFEPDAPGALAAAIRRFEADPSSFPVDPPVGRTWPDHLGQILGAYADAIEDHPSAR